MQPTKKEISSYIYSLLPLPLKSRINSKLTDEEKGLLLKTSQNKITAIHQQIKALEVFIHGMNSIDSQRKRITELAILLSFTILSVLIIYSFISASINYNSASHIIMYIEAILEGGGIHLTLLPPLLAYVIINYTDSITSILFMSQQYFRDIMISLIAGLCISILFLYVLPHHENTINVNFATILLFVTSISAGPLAEELFFRRILYRYLGERTGFTAGAAIVSIIFAAIHLPEGFPLFSVYFISSMIFCLLAWDGRHLLRPLSAHIFANLILFFI